MKSQLVYDAPLRAFHWTFVGLFAFAFFVAKILGEHSGLFSYHMIAGITLTLAVLLRIVWGFAGSKNSRFDSFALNPKELIAYFKGILGGSKRLWEGHNPASSWAAIVMFALSLGLGVSGYMMVNGGSEFFEEIHELFANAFIVVVIGHIVGIVLHTLRHKDMIGLSMVHGRKSELAAAENSTVKTHSGIAILFLTIIATFGLHLLRNFDNQNKTLNVFGTTLQLGEDEGKDEGEDQGKEDGKKKDNEEHDEDDDDHD